MNTRVSWTTSTLCSASPDNTKFTGSATTIPRNSTMRTTTTLNISHSPSSSTQTLELTVNHSGTCWNESYSNKYVYVKRYHCTWALILTKPTLIFRYTIRTNPSRDGGTPSTRTLSTSPAKCRERTKSDKDWSSDWSRGGQLIPLSEMHREDTCPVLQYYYTGFLALQTLIDYVKIKVSFLSQ